MFFKSIFHRNNDGPIKEVEKLIKDLTELKASVVDYANVDEIDMEIAEMIGSLKAKGDSISNAELVEFLVYLSDKTKTKADTNRNHFNDTMIKVVHAKIELLLIYHNGLSRGSIFRQIFSMATVWPVLFVLIVAVSILVSVHKYDPSLFYDIGMIAKNK